MLEEQVQGGRQRAAHVCVRRTHEVFTWCVWPHKAKLPTNFYTLLLCCSLSTWTIVTSDTWFKHVDTNKRMFVLCDVYILFVCYINVSLLYIHSVSCMLQSHWFRNTSKWNSLKRAGHAYCTLVHYWPRDLVYCACFCIHCIVIHVLLQRPDNQVSFSFALPL